MILCVWLAITHCSDSSAQTGAIPHFLGSLKRWDIVIGNPNRREVNINKLRVGPRGWVYGSTEENGYLFIVDPVTRAHVVWNAGSQTPRPPLNFEGDITDFLVWEEQGRLIILATHAFPARIYRYDVAIPAVGLPRIQPDDGVLVYENPRWLRVMSIETGIWSTGNPTILAGSISWAELIRSDDGGITWVPVDYLKGMDVDDARLYRNGLTDSSTIAEIQFINGTWILNLYLLFFLKSELTEARPYYHFINGLLVSHDGGESWRLSSVEPNRRLSATLEAAIDADRALARLPSIVYGLVGDGVQSIVRLSNGWLLAGTAMSNTPESPFGGRILESRDNGDTWSEVNYLPDVTDVRLLSLPGDIVLAGTVTQKSEIPIGAKATGEVWISRDGGHSFNLFATVVEADAPSTFRSPTVWYTGVASMVATQYEVFLGTVNEATYAELFSLDIRDVYVRSWERM